MRMLVPIFSTILIFLAGAAQAQEGQPTCEGCMSVPPNPVATAVRETRNTIASTQMGQAIADELDYWGIGKVCAKFANPSGFGDYGVYIKQKINPETHPALYQKVADVKKLCPGYSSFNDEQMEDFTVYLLAHLSYAESTCRPNASAQGPDGIAYGLLALHKNREYYSTPETIRNKCLKGDATTAIRSLRCGLAMLEGQISNRSAMFPRQSYWGPFTPQTRKKVTVQTRDPRNPERRLKAKKMNANTFIKEAVKRYPLCK